MGVGGFDPSAANREAYAGLVHGVASRPKNKTPSRPGGARGPPQPHSPNSRDTFTKVLRAFCPILDTQGTVC